TAAPSPAASATAQQEVNVTSSPPNSTLAAKVDFETLDSNRDGNLTRTEVGANAQLAADFNALDANRDGRVTKRELAGGK
ncbi:MAG TPA: hypothetical protein VGD42_21120, partial [Lysobacter sp.]